MSLTARAFVLLGALGGCARAVTPACGPSPCVDAAMPARDAVVVAPTPARPLAPLSTATVTSRRPVLHWTLGPGDDGARVEVCRDRACATVITALDVAGTSAAPGADLPTGVLFWRVRGRAGAVVDAAVSATWQFTVGARSAAVNTWWGSTLDVNGDGFADVAIGEPDLSSNTDQVYVYVGGPSGLSATPTTVLPSPGPDAFGFGESIASAGDIDGDGFGDLVIGARGALHRPGQVYVYRGSASGLRTTPTATLSDTGSTVNGFGLAVASAGDADNDGYGDLAVGSANGSGVVGIYRGSAAGLASSPALLLGADVGRQDFGEAIASAVDVNGDGFSDLVIGAPTAGGIAGKFFVFLGSAGGLSTTGTSRTSDEVFDSQFGGTLANAGDLNGDGFADILAGSEGTDVSGTSAAARVYLGSATGLPTRPTGSYPGGNPTSSNSMAGVGDVDGDGFADAVLRGVFNAHFYRGGVGPPASEPTVTLVAPDPTSTMLEGPMVFTVAGAGDVDGDGLADVLVGVMDSSPRIYVYPGHAAGLAATPGAIIAAPTDASGFFAIVMSSAP